MVKLRLIRQVEDVILGFEWHGGEYVQVCEREGFDQPKEVINVWDYESNKSRIPFTEDALIEKVEDWIESYGRQELAQDVKVHWRTY